MAFLVIYDASVLFPQSVRDLLIRLATTDLFQARWTEQILDEMVAAVVERYPDITLARMGRTRALMCEAVRDCLVTGYEPLIETVDLPDRDDRHVVAAALRCRAKVIVTQNIRDFPAETLEPLGIEAQTVDTFVSHLIDRAPNDILETVRRQAAALANPPMSTTDVIERLEIAGLSDGARQLRRLDALHE
ncbi:MAG: PIN domain-containing protein [Acidimicrobiia bacterium]|nr:MAG: PIN domain-containing protein [Acidimicrobiia bacterium]